MKPLAIVLVIALMLAAGCPPPEPEPDPPVFNTLTFNHDVAGRLVTELRLRLGDGSTGAPFGENLLNAPMLPGESVTIGALIDAYYQVEVTSAPLALGSVDVSVWDHGLITGGIDPTFNYSAFYP